MCPKSQKKGGKFPELNEENMPMILKKTLQSGA